MQAGERQLGLPLDAGHAEDHHLRRPPRRRGVTEESAFSHPRLTPQHEGTTDASTRAVQHAVDLVALAFASHELPCTRFRLTPTHQLTGG